MKLNAFVLFGLSSALVTAACSGSKTADFSSATPNVDGGPGSSSGSDANGPDDPGNAPPHSLGTVLLGESHAAGGGKATPLVSVGFVPDAQKAAACTATLAGCQITLAPKCTGAAGPTGCASDEACTFDGACKPTCTKIAICGTPCKDTETCVLDGSKGGSVGKCQAIESFDGGPVAFAGTTTPITLYPPYSYKSTGDGAPFLAGSEIRVQAQGAIGAGFDAFDEKFVATSFIQTTPALDKLPLEQVFGTGPLTVGWVPGSDSVVVTVAGGFGTAQCTAVDANGKLDVPRAVVDKVLGKGDPNATGALSLSVARQKKDVKKDKHAKGQLSSVAVQSTGWLALVTTSIETSAFQGCAGATVACGDACVDTTSDPTNCGKCGNVCPGTQSCSQGACGATCVSGPENTPAACSDGCSNDGDAYVDCDDYDCCPVRTDCGPTTGCGKKK